MGKNEKTPIDINGKPYYFEDLTDQQKMAVNHISDLDRKISSMQFNLDQLNVGRQAFVELLVKSLDETSEQAEAEQAAPAAE